MDLCTELIGLKEKRKAIVAFNIQTLTQLQALTEASKIYSAPVIIQFSEKYALYFDKLLGLEFLVNKFRKEGIYFHLDHSQNIDIIHHCADVGFDSVMFDGSEMPVGRNSAASNQIYDYVSKKKCLLEVELGIVGGVEDDKGSEKRKYVDLKELQFFHAQTKYDLLALGIGNAHGVYDTLDSININLFDDAKTAIGGERMFVLHGGTGMPESMIRSAVHKGVVKINISTALKIKTLNIAREYITQIKIFDEMKFQEKMFSDLIVFFSTYIASYTK